MVVPLIIELNIKDQKRHSVGISEDLFRDAAHGARLRFWDAGTFGAGVAASKRIPLANKSKGCNPFTF